MEEVNAAAKHFANSKIAIMGLHFCGIKPDDVVAIAKKRGLSFPIAIDEPNPTAQSFGFTFDLLGINAIPSCVVINSAGYVAYLGEFQREIAIANDLAQDK